MPAPNAGPVEAVTKRSDTQLTPAELLAFLNKHGISPKEFGQILGVSLQAVRLWLSGHRSISVTISRVVAMFEKYPALIRDF